MLRTLALATTALVAFAAPALAAGTLYYGQTATLPDLNPYILSPAHQPLNNTVFDGLTRYDENLEPQPRLAESWEFSEDGTSLTLHLREGVKFHNGNDFTSDDVAATVAFVQEPSHGALIQGFAKRITSVDTPDAHTAVLNFAKPFPGVFDLLELMYIVDNDTENAFATEANGTGPFKVVSHETGTRTTFEANADYWDGAPELDGVEIVIVPNQQAELLALRSGDLDLVTELGYIDLVPFTRDDRYKTGDAPSGVAHDITINIRNAPLDNVKVREAIDLAIDRERIARLLFGNLGRTWCLPFDSNSIAFVEEENDCEFDLDKAREVLESAGVDLPLNISMLTSSEIRTEYTTIAEIMQADLKEIGINLSINNVDAVTYRKLYIEDNDFELISHAFGRAEKDPSSLLETTVVFKPEGNVSGFSDPAYTDAVARGGSTPDEAERRAAYAEASKILRDSHHVLSIVPRPRLYVTTDKIDGLELTADGFVVLQDVTKSE